MVITDNCKTTMHYLKEDHERGAGPQQEKKYSGRRFHFEFEEFCEKTKLHLAATICLALVQPDPPVFRTFGAN